MNLKDLPIKIHYDATEDNLVDSFYNPVLSKAKKYYRIAGYFSSTSLAIAAKGIASLIKNKGHMRILCSPNLSHEDYNALNEVYLLETIEKRMLDDLENIEDELVRDYISCFGWMLANNYLEIKLVIGKNTQLFHQKIGIIIDKDSNILSFSGSINETAAGWVNNIEEFKTFKSWDNSKEYCLSDLEKFSKYWEGLQKDIKVLEFPQAVQMKLINKQPTSIDDLLAVIKMREKTIYGTKKNIPLYHFQKKALEYWKKNNKKALFEMATGTGKTRTAVACIDYLLNQYPNNVVVITAPQKSILDQWEKECRTLLTRGFNSFSVSDTYNWKEKLKTKILEVETNLIDNLIIYVCHDSVYLDSFTDKIKNLSLNVKLTLIADEVHGLGAKKRRNCLLERYDFRIGLSATPERHFDDYGSRAIIDFFHNNKFEFGIDAALSEINPTTGRTFLVQYDYLPVFVNLTSEEIEKYREITKRIAKLLHLKETNPAEYEDNLTKLLNMRAEIHKSAENKLAEFDKLISEIKPIKNTIVFTSPKLRTKVQQILNSHEVIATSFTHEKSSKRTKKNLFFSERERILKLFTEGRYDALIAIKCLDEGVDIPSAQIGILLSSSANPREYIQRLGRILRNSPQKSHATIYDFIVVPSFIGVDNELSSLELQIFEKEYKRIYEIARYARNNVSITKIINERFGRL